MLTQEYLKTILNYDPLTGIFTWIKSDRGGWVGKQAGFIHDPDKKTGGYVVIGIQGKSYRAHRLAWLYMMGSFPETGIDHINLIRHDNRFFNLRECTQAGNTANIMAPVTNTSGVKGVTWNKARKKWTAQITSEGIRYYLGIFSDKEDAIKAIQEARIKYHGEFANHG